MTDEQINIAIAESLGEIDPRYTTTGGFIASYVINGVTVGFHGLPNYTADLNACHEFESEIIYSNDRLPKKYTQQIKSAICREAGVKKAQMDFDLCITATARQRCEAYLRTLNLFVD